VGSQVFYLSRACSFSHAQISAEVFMANKATSVQCRIVLQYDLVAEVT